MVSFLGQRQSVVAMSTTEAEYIVASNAAKEAIWLRHFLSDVGIKQEEPTILNVDNQGAIIRNPIFHKRMKHIDVRYHFIREKINERELSLERDIKRKKLHSIFYPLNLNIIY